MTRKKVDEHTTEMDLDAGLFLCHADSALIHLCDRELEKKEDTIKRMETLSRHFICGYGIQSFGGDYRK